MMDSMCVCVVCMSVHMYVSMHVCVLFQTCKTWGERVFVCVCVYVSECISVYVSVCYC